MCKYMYVQLHVHGNIFSSLVPFKLSLKGFDLCSGERSSRSFLSVDVLSNLSLMSTFKIVKSKIGHHTSWSCDGRQKRNFACLPMLALMNKMIDGPEAGSFVNQFFIQK